MALRCRSELKSRSVGPHIENFKQLLEKMGKYADKFAQGARAIDKYSPHQKSKAQSCVPVLSKDSSISPINQNSSSESDKRNSEEGAGMAEQRAVIESLRTLAVERRADVSQRVDEAALEVDKEEGPPLDFNDDEEVIVKPFSKYDFDEEDGAKLRC
jgi:hypothetical protein